ncbi:MAG: DUF2809 domain-containing protein [Candidatus Eremiobacteraeota bacterium]|nr:DUF2809 domain-containing protein [Candidatus Eremiobacteraeota bacterium]
MRRNYALATLILLATEVFIALKVHDRFIRPFVGDALVVILVYTALQTLFLKSKKTMAHISLAIAFLIETLQAVDFAAYLGADRHPWLSVILGRTFSPDDYLAYLAGYGVIRLLDRASPGQAEPAPRSPHP